MTLKCRSLRSTVLCCHRLFVLYVHVMFHNLEESLVEM